MLVEKDGTRYRNDACKRRTVKLETAADGSEQSTTYHWDCRDRLRQVVLADGRLVEFAYDAFARRVRKTVTAAPALPLAEALREALKGGGVTPLARATTRMLWDGDVLCAEVRDAGGEASVRVHVHEPGSFVPMLQAEDGAVYSVVTDHLGMPKELVDGQGRVAWAASHSAWGRVLEVQRDPVFSEGAAEVSSPFRLLGQQYDDETGLCYTRFRYFDAEAGRWCSPDPLGMLGGKNLGAFDGSPSAIADPFGLACPKYPTIPTPYGDADQDTRAAFLAARSEVEAGATLYRIGSTGFSDGAEGQFWALEHPLSPGYAARYGIPPSNVARFDFIETAVVPPGTPFVTRPAPPYATNPGGGPEVVVGPNTVRMKSFTTVDPNEVGGMT